MALLEETSDENTACKDAIEALRCVICSPRQAHFMQYSQTAKGPEWEIDVCLPTALATFEFCHSEKDLFPENSGVNSTPPPPRSCCQNFVSGKQRPFQKVCLPMSPVIGYPTTLTPTLWQYRGELRAASGAPCVG